MSSMLMNVVMKWKIENIVHRMQVCDKCLMIMGDKLKSVKTHYTIIPNDSISCDRCGRVEKSRN